MAITDPTIPAASSSRSERDILPFRLFLIVGMVGCIAGAWVSLAEVAFSSWSGTYLMVLSMLVTIDALASKHLARAAGVHSNSMLVLELAVALVVLRLAIPLRDGLTGLQLAIRAWIDQPIRILMDGEYIFASVLVVLLWVAALDIANMLYEMDDPDAPGQDSRKQFEDLGARFLAGGCVLMVSVALAQTGAVADRLGLSSAERNRFTWLPLLYLLLGLLLFGQARFALLRRAWLRQGIAFEERISRRWVTWGLLFLTLVSIIAVLMPAGSTEAGLYLFMWLTFLVATVAALLTYLINALFYRLLGPLFSIFSSPERTPPPIPEIQIPPASQSGVEAVMPAWWAQLRMTLFWVTVLAVLALLLYNVALQWKHSHLWERLSTSLSQWLVDLWNSFIAMLGWGRADGRKTTRDNLATRWSSLSARLAHRTVSRDADLEAERVRRIYLRFLADASRAGHPRRLNQSPVEYETTLRPEISGEEEALRQLTDSFVRARYGRAIPTDVPPHWLTGLVSRVLARLRKSATSQQ